MTMHWYLIRDEDPSGISGVGRVAEVVQLENGKVVVGFLPNGSGVASVIVYDSVEDALAIHGHNGLTRLEEAFDGHQAAGAPGRL